MRYGPLLQLAGVAFCIAGLFGVHGLGFGDGAEAWTLWLARGALGYIGVSLFLVGCCYYIPSAAVLGKTPEGRRCPWGYLVAGPFLAMMWLGRALQRLVDRERAFDEVAPGIYVGRVPSAGALPKVELVVDMTSEFLVPLAVRGTPSYRCLPTLDGSVPALAAYLELVEILAGAGDLYIHCAAGHGRSATVAAGVLIRRGLARDVDEALALMQVARPRVRLVPEQRRMVMRVRASA